MPMLVSRGAASGKGFGLTNAVAGGGTLQTVTFNSSGNWIAPPSVTVVATLSGKGAPGQSDYTGGASAASSGVSNAGSGSGASGSLPLSWDSVAAIPITVADLLNSGFTGSPLSNISRTFVFYPNNTFSFSDSGGGTFPYTPVVGTWSVAGGPFSGNLSYGDSASYVAVGQVYYSGYAGASSTALGQSFPGGAYSGGTGYPASTTTYTNVSVTPGVSYYINVASSGQVVLQYYT